MDRDQDGRAGVIFLPGGEIEVGQSGDLRSDGPPRTAKVECFGSEDNLEL